MAPAVACLATNPLEVAKVRQQMQGELGNSGGTAYRGTYATLRTILAREGVQVRG